MKVLAPVAAVGTVCGVPSGSTRNSVTNLLNDRAAARRLRSPAGDAVHEACRDVIGFDRMIREDPQCVFSAGLVGCLAVLDPVDCSEDNERMRTVEVDPEHAAIRTKTDDATGDGEIAVVICEDLVRDGEEVECGFSE